MPPHRYAKGHKKMGGRKKGGLNKKTLEIAQFSRELFADVFKDPAFAQQVKNKILAGKESPLVMELLKYGYGKPPDKIQLSGPDGGPIEINDADALLDKLTSRLTRLAPPATHPAGTEPV